MEEANFLNAAEGDRQNDDKERGQGKWQRVRQRGRSTGEGAGLETAGVAGIGLDGLPS